jgi:threonine/homoserine/homoserine lactone efflux protein
LLTDPRTGAPVRSSSGDGDDSGSSGETSSGRTGATGVLVSTGTSSLSAPIGVPVNAPISWGQVLGGFLSDYLNPAVILAFLVVLATWLQSSAPITSRGIVTVIVVALVAAMQAALHVTANDGLGRRLRATGQIKGGL